MNSAPTSVDLRLELDMQRVREWYDEYVADVAFYVAEDNLDPQHPDQGYRTGEPEPFEQYAADVLSGVLDDVICAHPGYRVVRA